MKTWINIKKVQGIFFMLFLSIIFVFAACKKDDANDENNNNDDNTEGISGYPIVTTNQSTYYNNSQEISAPATGEEFYGQDAQYESNALNYQDNGDGTVTDLVTGLMWQKSPDFNADGAIDALDKMTFEEAKNEAYNFDLAGYDDWRLPSIKELYSLIIFSGFDVSGYEGTTDGLVPFIDTDYFEFGYGDESAGERIIDAQYASSTKYVDYTMYGDETLFGVNFADGRIKGYGLEIHGSEKEFYVIYVRGNESYGINNFVDNGDGTISDLATGLMWLKDDSGEAMNWEDALSYAEDLDAEGYSDWRLPDVKELQSILDYTKSPSSSDSPAIDSKFNCTEITNEAGESDYGYYWSSTTHANWSLDAGTNAAYISFGRAMGYMESWVDVHGAGAQRSDPKTGNPDDYPYGHGPQGDAIRINNFVRCVRTIN